ncbi:MAG: hypothetical protein SNJ56_06800, partial [Termitinemataceae bacterium]
LIRLQPRGIRWFSQPARDLAKLKLEKWWKHAVEKKVLSILEPTGLIPETPHNMDRIMENTQEHFVNLELNSEIAVSSGVAATAMQSGGYSGIVNISPFACLIGRVIEGLFTPWARDRNYPTLSVEVDGNLLPPNIINKLNIFMVNVLRFKGNQDLSTLIDKAGAEGVAVTGHLAAAGGDQGEKAGRGRNTGVHGREGHKTLTAIPLTTVSVTAESDTGERRAAFGEPAAEAAVTGAQGTEAVAAVADAVREKSCDTEDLSCTSCGGCSGCKN